MRRRLPGLGFGVLLLASCEGTTPPGGARLEARWSGTDTSHFSAEAGAEWCDSLRVLTIQAMRGDTGVGLAIHPGDSIASGSFPIRRPVRPDTTPADSAAGPHPASTAPSAALALRWFSKTVVRGFQGDSGEVTLRRDATGRLGGQFAGSAHSMFDDGRVRVTGTFAGLRPRPAAAGCGRRVPPSAVAPAGDTAGRDSPGVD